MMAIPKPIPYRWHTAKAYHDAQRQHFEGVNVSNRRELMFGVIVDFGPVFDITRHGTKWGGMGWRVHYSTNGGFMYFTGPNAESRAYAFATVVVAQRKDTR